MGYMTNGLTFNALRGANTARLPQFKNRHGAPAHSKADGSDWSPAQWLQAVLGELGEYANLRKKFERGDVDSATFLREAADELADVATYLDLLAMQLGVDLGAAIIDKFNRVSQRVSSTVRLDADDWRHEATASAAVKAVADEPQTVSPAKRYVKLAADGVELPIESNDHAILIDHKLGLMIDVRDDRKAKHYDAPKVAAETNLLGYKDWRLANDLEAFPMFDRTRYSPAVDPTLYPNAKSGDFIWTSSVDPENSDYAFAVYCGDGGAYWYHRLNVGVVRAVRSLAPSPGQ